MIAVYLDEDMSQHQLVWALRSRGFDVMTSFEAGMNGKTDDCQLAFASGQGRLIVTANVRDFASLHRTWLAQLKPHAGIIVVPRQRYSTGEIVRRLLRVAASGVDVSSTLYYPIEFLMECR